MCLGDEPLDAELDGTCNDPPDHLLFMKERMDNVLDTVHRCRVAWGLKTEMSSSSESNCSGVSELQVTELREFLENWESSDDEPRIDPYASSAPSHLDKMKDSIACILSVPWRRSRRPKLRTYREFSFPLAVGCDDLWFDHSENEIVL